MNQAIVTKFIAPTQFRGMRVKATAGAGSVVIPWQDEWDVEDNHSLAAKMYQQKMQWAGELKGGVMANGDYCFVLVPVEKWRALSPADTERIPCDRHRVCGKQARWGLNTGSAPFSYACDEHKGAYDRTGTFWKEDQDGK